MKIAIIGGGSLTWSFGLVRQFVASENLQGTTVSLMDLDASALDLVGQACFTFNRSADSPIDIETTVHRDNALDGADFVLICISTGGLEAMRHDLEIPQDHGIYHTVGDTVGPGGWLRAVRNLPVFNGLADAIERRCPHAWVLNMTNPLTALTRLLARRLGDKVIGMCPGVEEQVRSFATLIGADVKHGLEYTVTGIDHGSYFTRLIVGETDVLQTLRHRGFYRSDDQLPSELFVDDPMAMRVHSRAIFAIWREIGYLPSISDRHAVENFSWFLANGSEELPFGIQRTSVDQRVAWQAGKEQALRNYIECGDDQHMNQLGHGDDPVGAVIESLSGHRSFLWGSNYQNVGQTPQAPQGAVVESRCLFDKHGVHPESSPMPAALMPIVLPTIHRQEAIVDIALDGTFDQLVSLVLTDPLCARLDITDCRRMVGSMLQANCHYIVNKRLLHAG